jgi:hypothetical protein
VDENIKSFLTSMFQDFVRLRQALSTVKQAASCDSISLHHVSQLYRTSVENLTESVHDRLLEIQEKVESMCCYSDGILALGAFARACNHGLHEHLNKPPLNLSEVLKTWTLAQEKLDQETSDFVIR